MLAVVALLAGCGTGTSPPSDAVSPPDTGCVPTTWYADADGDGHGDASAATEACAPPPGAVTVGDDCDDADPEVFPGAEERCDGGADDDCDGVPGAAELDGDGDGSTPCDGDCDDTRADVSPAAKERCDGVDDDCDGAVDLDDDSVDRYTCGYCPDASQASTATFATRTLNPCVLDPSVSLCSPFPVFWPDTNTRGERLHRLIWRDDGLPLRDDLFLYLPPGPGEHDDHVLLWAAFAGYRVISLGWQNEAPVADCPTPQCFGEMRQEMLDGTDSSPDLDIWPTDSLVGRLDTLMAYLVATYPAEGWDAWWDPQRGMRWDHVVVSGWSVGAGEAAFLGKAFATKGLVLVSGPMDRTPDAPADWMFEPRATESCRQWGMYHQEEPGTNYETGGPDLWPEMYGLLGIPGPVVDVDTASPPYGDARLLTTDKTAYTEDWCTPHGAMAEDECMDPSLSAMYLYAYCAAGDLQSCP